MSHGNANAGGTVTPRARECHERGRPRSDPEGDVEERVEAEHADEGVVGRESRAAEAPVRHRDRPDATGGEDSRRADAGEHDVRAQAEPGVGRAIPAERPAEDRRVGRKRDKLGAEAHDEPGRVRLLDRVANLTESRRAHEQQADADEEQHRGDHADHGTPPRRNDLTRGATVDHLSHSSAREGHESRRAATPSAAPAKASRT